jgi:class 3 adenylate cyclase/TolB-like protein
MERRLAAILAADVAGYSRLMGTDEAGTLRALKTHRRELVDPKVAEHHGHIVKLMGDGMLIEFNSVVDAVAAAVAVQLAMQQRNRATAPDKAVTFRIGINIGDVIVEDGDIYGEGVNVAARLEALAQPGGICISRNVRDEIRNKLDLTLNDLGEIEVKNISRPVRAFNVALDAKTEAMVSAGRCSPGLHRTPFRSGQIAAAAALLAAVTLGGAAWSFATRDDPAPAVAGGPSIAVLPFTDLSGDSGDAGFTAGLTEDIISALAQASDLPVFAPETTVMLPGARPDAREAARKLGAAFVLAGTVRRSADDVRVTTRLIDARDGTQLWSETQDREFSAAGVFALQDDVADAIAGVVASKAWTHLVHRYFERSHEPMQRALLAQGTSSEPDPRCRRGEYVSSLDRPGLRTEN